MSDKLKNLVEADFINKLWTPSDEHFEKLFYSGALNVKPPPPPPEYDTQVIHIDFINKRKVA